MFENFRFEDEKKEFEPYEIEIEELKLSLETKK
jgi:hypothetical protein